MVWPGTVFSTTASLSTTTAPVELWAAGPAALDGHFEGHALLDAVVAGRETAPAPIRARRAPPRSGTRAGRGSRRGRACCAAQARATVRSMVPSPPRLTARSTVPSSSASACPEVSSHARRHGARVRRARSWPARPSVAASGRSGCTTKAIVATTCYRASGGDDTSASGAWATAASSAAAQAGRCRARRRRRDVAAYRAGPGMEEELGVAGRAQERRRHGPHDGGSL